MAFFIESDMRAISKNTTQYFTKSVDAILEERISGIPLSQKFNIFLSHSFIDAELILGIKIALEQLGYSVYVDHQVDPQMSRQKVTIETASVLKERMRHSESLFYVSSYNSQNSVWMPWELGYFDGIRGTAAIPPLFSRQQSIDEYSGQEYLGIYPYITYAPTNNNPDNRLWINWSPNEYVVFEDWVKGKSPILH